MAIDNIAKKAEAYKPKERVTYKMIKDAIGYRFTENRTPNKKRKLLFRRGGVMLKKTL